jgi:L-seryl-tRNA(Ser) seleniumtransferase
MAKKFRRETPPEAEMPGERGHPPSMDALLSAPGAAPFIDRWGREAVKEELRAAIAAGATRSEDIYALAGRALPQRFESTLGPAINATGVLLHTNLGRAPLGENARRAVERAAEGYSTLEYDAATGERGSRQDHVRGIARDVFGCEDAIAVNNNASAVLLALCALARGRRVLISRGELVAIGGSFQIPAILEASGASLAEVGTTNRTTIDDYRRGLSPDVALLLTVHPSNYEIRGYTATPAPDELAALAREANLPWVHDQGTGCVVDLAEFGVPDEPTVRACLQGAGAATLVTFSGDKLLGGPQAGIVAGRADAVASLARHPVARAVRPDKLTLAALHATLTDWKTGRWRDLPVYRAAGTPVAELERRGAAIARETRTARASSGRSALAVEVVESLALFGGGTSPEKRFPSRALALADPSADADEIAAALRASSPPVVGRVDAGRVHLDLRSIRPQEDAAVSAALASLGPRA